MNLYTKTGDDGYTQSADGTKLPKYDILIELTGTLDEVTSILGMAKSMIKSSEFKNDINVIQKQLICVMGEISGGRKYVTPDIILKLENLCDRYMDKPINNFVIPGENSSSAILDIARTVVRRGERACARAFHDKRVSNEVLVYLNRLSDVLFAMARKAEE